MNPEVTQLSTGLTVVTDPMPQLESAALGVWVNVGGRNETRPVMGVSHMLEHMAFKGTARRTAQEIAEEIEAVGGYMNAYTSREQTAFHVRTLKRNVPLAIDILGDILMRPAFEQVELERERQVVLQEIGQARDTPDDIVFDHLQSVAYPDQPIGWPILGNEDTVSNFAREHLQDYMAANYRASSMILVASGAVEHEHVLELAAQAFSEISAGTAATPASAGYVGGDCRVHEDLEQVHVTYAFPGVSNTDPDFYTFQVYAAALGGGMSSRLFQEAREKRGLCYSIYSFGQSFSDGGMLGIYVGTGENQAAEISAVVAGEMANLAATATDREIARAKAQMKSGLLMGLERPTTRAEQIAGQIFAFGRLIEVDELTAKIDAVSAASVRSFGERIMNGASPSIAVVGPHNSLERFERFAARFGAGVARAAE
ncbi:MAG TPA: pitrilysin family protein [Rhizomicrobium sp.]|nr:pitrilysin family protein [Rhizomicrobium sp.]